jgi:hypothetical protein
MANSTKDLMDWRARFPAYNGDKGTDPNGDIAWWDFMRKRSWAAQDAINSMLRVLNPAIMHGMTTDWQGKAINPTARSFSGGLGSGLPGFQGGSDAPPPSAGLGSDPAGGLRPPPAPAAPASPQSYPGPGPGGIVGQQPAIPMSLVAQLANQPSMAYGSSAAQPNVDPGLLAMLAGGGATSPQPDPQALMALLAK